MSTGGMLYLVLVVCTFLVFAGALAYFTRQDSLVRRAGAATATRSAGDLSDHAMPASQAG